MYVDLTNFVSEKTKEAEEEDLIDERADLADLASPARLPSDVHVEGGLSVAFLSPVERRMLQASALVREIRCAIYAKERITVSGA